MNKDLNFIFQSRIFSTCIYDFYIIAVSGVYIAVAFSAVCHNILRIFHNIFSVFHNILRVFHSIFRIFHNISRIIY